MPYPQTKLTQEFFSSLMFSHPLSSTKKNFNSKMKPARSTSVCLINFKRDYMFNAIDRLRGLKATPQLNTQTIAPFEDFEVMERPFLKRQTLPGVVLTFLWVNCVLRFDLVYLVMIRNMNMQSKQHWTKQFYRARRGTSSYCCRCIRFSNRTMSKLAWPEIHFVTILYVKLASFDSLFTHIAIIFHYELIQSLDAKIILKRLKTSQVNTHFDKTANWSTGPLGMLVSEENPSLRVLMKVFQSHSSEWMDMVM